MTAHPTNCPSCDAPCAADARFCSACGARLTVASQVATEVKVVTTLFADLAGYTALGERYDPEDIHAVLRAFYEMARAAVERFGGVVEKYIGDAVVGVFGAPTAHEDDPERAVRAALAVVAGMAALPRLEGELVQVRVGVNTGRSLVRIGADPAFAEALLIGDAVNTASRLLAAAAPMSVVVGDATRDLSVRAIDYEELAPFSVKGKTRPVRAWLARGTTARRDPDVGRIGGAPMIGREIELGVLHGVFERACASSSPQYALIIGEAGIGKSRLVNEFGLGLDRRPGLLCTWRLGSCPAYGDGLAFWALGEIVSAHAGILQSDGAAVIETKLLRVFGDTGQDEWMASRLRPLVGLPAVQSDQEENFAAWLRFLEGLARERPTVLVLEDVHWASEALLAFLGYLVRHAAGVPLLVIATARPEFREAHPGIAAFPSVHTVELRSLDEHESARLAAELPDAGRVPGLAEMAVARCGGNPLFTEELVRYVAERCLRTGSGPDAVSDVDVPASLRALIAARLDVLRPEQKALLSDAAVVGRVFWPGALAAMDGRDLRTALEILGELERHEFVRSRSSSSMAAESEYAFRHALIREVAYDQMPRSARAARHAAVARWIDETGDLGGIVAEVRAYHYAAAYELARLSGDDVLAADVREPAMSALRAAGDRALSTDVALAESHYERALALSLPDDAVRPYLTVALAEANVHDGRLAEAIGQLQRGIAELRAAGDRRAAAVSMTRLSSALYWRDADSEAGAQLRAEALDLLVDDGPSEALVTVLEECAVQSTRDLLFADAVRFADQAIAMSARLGLPERVRSIAYRGASLCALGDDAGLAELRRARDLARGRADAINADAACQLLAELTYGFQGPDAALALSREGHEHASRRGGRLTPLWFRQQAVEFERLRGDWQAALSGALEIEAVVEDDARVELPETRLEILLLRLLMGDTEEAARLLDEAAADTGAQAYFRSVVMTLQSALQAATGDLLGARESLARLGPALRDRSVVAFSAAELPLIVRLALEAGVPDLVAALVHPPGRPRAIDACTTVMAEGLAAELEGRYEHAACLLAEAAASWSAFGNPWEAALALRDRGRCLLRLGRTHDAAAALTEAREVFARLGARPALADAEALLAQATGVGRPPASG